MTKKDIKKIISIACVQRKGETRITCSQALKIAELCNISPSRVGLFCDEAGIKIRSCRLGCF